MLSIPAGTIFTNTLPGHVDFMMFARAMVEKSDDFATLRLELGQLGAVL
jgi:hypothetical protein